VLPHHLNPATAANKKIIYFRPPFMASIITQVSHLYRQSRRVIFI